MVVVLVAGASGACGRFIVAECLRWTKCTKVIALSRSWGEQTRAALSAAGVAMDDQRLVLQDFSQTQWEDMADGKMQLSDTPLVNVNVVFSSLATTRKDAGKLRAKIGGEWASRFSSAAAAFQRIDGDYPCALFKLAKEAGVDCVGNVSAAGASAGSLFLYPSVKGTTDDFIAKAGFGSSFFAKPGLIDRDEKARLVEKCFSWIPGFSIPAKFVGVGLARAALQSTIGNEKKGRVDLGGGELSRLAKAQQ